MRHYGDITKINGAEVPIVDVVVGGSPCQDLSVAGKRAGLDGARSGLFMEQIRIVKEMREHDKLEKLRCGRSDELIRPRYMVWENVTGAFSSNGGEDFRIVLEETARIADKTAVIPKPPKGKWSFAGCIVGDGWSLAWRTTDNQFWGTPQRRRRIALVADFGGERAAEILFERNSLSGDTSTRGEKGQGTSETAERHADAASYTLKVRGGCERDCYGRKAGKGALIQTELSATLGVSQDQTLITLEGNGSRDSHRGDGYKESEVMYTLNTVEQHAVCMNPWDVQSKHIQPENGVAEALYSGECRYGGGESYVVYGISAYESNAMKSSNPHSGIYVAETSRTLNLNGGSPACNQGGMAVVQGINGDVAGTLDANYYKGCGEREGTEREVVCIGNGQAMQTKMSEKVGTLNCMHDQQAVMVYGLDRASFNQGQNAQYDFAVEEELAPTVLAKGPGGVLAQQ